MDLIDLEQAVQELAGKIIVKRRDNEAQQRAQQAAIDKNEGKIFLAILDQSSIFRNYFTLTRKSQSQTTWFGENVEQGQGSHRDSA